jgi:thiamine kinase-like enzyme
VDIKELHGGITNSNYLVNQNDQMYVVRMVEEQPLLGIDRRNEVLCMKIGYKCGISPDVIYTGSGIMVTNFVQGKVLQPENVSEEQYLSLISGVLKIVHGSGHKLSGEILYFSPFQVVRTYYQRAIELTANMPKGLSHAIDEVELLENEVGPFIPTLCHNDVLAANWIFDGSKMWLIDWEYAGIGNPMFDLGNLAHNSGFEEDMDRALLEVYFGKYNNKLITEFKIMKAVSALRECLWSLIQTKISDLDFDFHEYATDNLHAYNNFLKQLG